jgi:hypothetical protein
MHSIPISFHLVASTVTTATTALTIYFALDSSSTVAIEANYVVAERMIVDLMTLCRLPCANPFLLL